MPVQVDALAGTPYGVARLFFPAGQIEETQTLRFMVTDSENRILFPAVDIITSNPPEVNAQRPGERSRIGAGALVNRIRSAIQNAREQIDPPELIRVQFLFRGSTPLNLRLSGDFDTQVQVSPTLGPDWEDTSQNSDSLTRALQHRGLLAYTQPFQTLLRSWWDGYVQQAVRQIEHSDYPPIVESYLTHLLANRYRLDLPELFTKKRPSKKQTDPIPTLELVAGIEELRSEIFRSTLRQIDPSESQRVAVPSSPRWLDMPVPETPANLEIETIAKAVPPECYYLRFASFSNYLWFQELSQTRGGDLAQMAVLRGFNYETNRRMERLLNTKTTMVAKLFGDSIIEDMAIIGQDLYLQEGPSLGVLFEAKNVTLLKTSLNQERLTAEKQFASQGCTLKNLEIGGKNVSLLSTPDNQIRSFMVDQGNFVFLTTSHRLVERFLDVQSQGNSLGDTKAFRFARLMMPVQNRYDVFAYLSSEFFRNLVSPHYQIELRRRLKAIASIEIAEIATLAFKAENPKQEAEPTMDRLMSEGFLPQSLQIRADGSQTLAYSGRWHDSLRGRRGSFLPIADVKVEECSSSEALEYKQQATFYASQWQQTDPLMFGIRRFSGEPQETIERIAIEAYIAPLGRDKYGWLSAVLAPPVRTEIQLPPDDVVNWQLHLAGQHTARFNSPDHVMFAGLKDTIPPVPGESKGILGTLRTLQSLPAYLGAWPRPGYLDRLPLGLGGPPPDAFGFSKLLIGLWRWQMGGFSVLSFDKSILENCMLHLRPIPAKDFAQGRLKIGNIEQSRLSNWFNTLWFRRAAQTTRGNLMFLDSIQSQLKVPAASALTTAEMLIDAKLQCSLGGRYDLSPDSNAELPLWQSTAWPEQIHLMNGLNGKPLASKIGFDSSKSLPPSEYKAPWLQWFRGAHLHLTQLPERLIVVGTIDIEPIPVTNMENKNEPEKTLPLPKMNLDLFNLPFQFFQGDKPKSSDEKNKAPPETKKSF